MAGYAQRFGVRLGQYDLSILCRRMADFALLVGKWGMGEFCHQLGSGRLVRIMTAQAIRRLERLVLVRLLEFGVLHVMAAEAKRRRCLRQVKIKLGLSNFSRLMGEVASLAPHVQSGVTTALRRDVYARFMTTQAEVVFLAS